MRKTITRDTRLVIGIDASRANQSRRTGVEWYAYNLIQALKSEIPRGVRVILYSREPLRDGLEHLPEGWESRVLHWPFRFWTQVRLSWEMAVRPPDLLFVPAHVLPLVLPKRCVTTVHDLGFFVTPEAYSKAERTYQGLAARLAARRANHLLTVSEFSRHEIVRLLGVPEDRVTVTPLAADSVRFRADIPADDVAAVAARYGLREPYYLYVGRLERKKNLPVLVEAFRRYRAAGGQAKLTLVGDRGFGADEELSRLAGERDIVGAVRELGYVAPEDLPALYAAARAFVFPSRFEGFGLPILEAFSCGTPVIASNVASIPEVAGGAAILLDADDAAGFAEAMLRLDRDDMERRRLAEAGLARARSFDWPTCARITWQALSKSP